MTTDQRLVPPTAAALLQGLLSLTTDDVAFVLLALNQQARRYDRNGRSVPTGVAALRRSLVAGLALRDSPRGTVGQDGSHHAAGSAVAAQLDEGLTDSELISIEEGALMLGISKSTMQRQVRAGVFQTVTVSPGRRKLRRRDIRKAIDHPTQD